MSPSMDQVRFRPFTSDDLAAYACWFTDDEVARRVTFPGQDWLSHVLASGSAHAVVALLATEQAPVAMLQYDDEPDGGISFSIVIDPSRRGRGLGSLVLSAFAAQVGNRYAYVDGHIEDDNIASLACVERCGFLRWGDDPDEGFVHYRWTPNA